MKVDVQPALFGTFEREQLVRFDVSASIQEDIRALFADQALRFFLDKESEPKEIVPFDPTYHLEDDQLFVLDGFDHGAAFIRQGHQPLSIPSFSGAADQLRDLRAVVVAGNIARDDIALLQPFERSQVLRKGPRSLVLSRHTFQQLDSDGMTLDSKIEGVAFKNKLLFRSFSRMARVFDLRETYREASEGQVADFARSPQLLVQDQAALSHLSDAYTRRRIFLIKESGVLDSVDVRKLRAAARAYNIDIEVRKVGAKQRIVVPTQKKAFKELIRFLADDYLQSGFSSNRYLTNSKRRL